MRRSSGWSFRSPRRAPSPSKSKEDAPLGYVCLAPSGAILESNRRAHEQALLYGPGLDLLRRLRMLADLIAHAEVRVAEVRVLRILRHDGEAILEIRGHVLAKETHALREDVARRRPAGSAHPYVILRSTIALRAVITIVR